MGGLYAAFFLKMITTERRIAAVVALAAAAAAKEIKNKPFKISMTPNSGSPNAAVTEFWCPNLKFKQCSKQL